MKDNETQSRDVSISFSVPLPENANMEELIQEFLRQLADEDVIVGLGALDKNRLGLAFTSSSPGHEKQMIDKLHEKVSSVWPLAQVISPHGSE